KTGHRPGAVGIGQGEKLALLGGLVPAGQSSPRPQRACLAGSAVYQLGEEHVILDLFPSPAPLRRFRAEGSRRPRCTLSNERKLVNFASGEASSPGAEAKKSSRREKILKTPISPLISRPWPQPLAPNLSSNCQRTQQTTAAGVSRA